MKLTLPRHSMCSNVLTVRLIFTNFRELSSLSMHVFLLNLPRSLGLIAAMDIRISDTHQIGLFFDDHENYALLSQLRMLFRKGLDLELWTIFWDKEYDFMFLSVSVCESGAFRLVTVYTPMRSENPYFFWRCDSSLATSRSLMLLGNCNAILDAPPDGW